MSTDNITPPHEPNDQSLTLEKSGADWELIAFLALGLTAILLPFCLRPFVGIFWGALAAIGVNILWFKLMPTTCINGAFICSIVAMASLSNTIGFVLAAILRIVVFSFK